MNKKIKEFFKYTTPKIIVFFFIFLYLLFVSFDAAYWGHQLSPIPILLILPLTLTNGFALILLLPYSYAIACALVAFASFIKERKMLIVPVFLVFFFLMGIDEPIINSTINRPDYSCNMDSDCSLKVISKGECGKWQCVNKNWNYYDSRINSVFALSCGHLEAKCSCVQNRCNTTYFSLIESLSQRIRIKNAICNPDNTTIITVINVGMKGVAKSELSVSVDNVAKTCDWSGMPVEPGSIATCTIKELGGKTGSEIRVTAPANKDVIICD